MIWHILLILGISKVICSADKANMNSSSLLDVMSNLAARCSFYPDEFFNLKDNAFLSECNVLNSTTSVSYTAPNVILCGLLFKIIEESCKNPIHLVQKKISYAELKEKFESKDFTTDLCKNFGKLKATPKSNESKIDEAKEILLGPNCARVCYDLNNNANPLCKLVLWGYMKLQEEETGAPKMINDTIKNPNLPGVPASTVPGNTKPGNKTSDGKKTPTAIVYTHHKALNSNINETITEISLKGINNHNISKVLTMVESPIEESKEMQKPKTNNTSVNNINNNIKNDILPQSPPVIIPQVKISKARTKSRIDLSTTENIFEQTKPQIPKSNANLEGQSDIYNQLESTKTSSASPVYEPEDTVDGDESFLSDPIKDEDQKTQPLLKSYESDDSFDSKKHFDIPSSSAKEVLDSGDIYIVKKGYGYGGAEESHFFTYFMCMMVLCIIGYFIIHNKQKILALALEGRSRKSTRRRPNSSGYRKLDSNLEEAVTSGTYNTSATQVIY